MSEANLTGEAAQAVTADAGTDRLGAWIDWFESKLAWFDDRLNPILVKEARQALKSRQFSVTFILVLTAGWCWSIIGIAWMGPAVYWSAEGPSMFFGYFIILAFPLLAMVPYSAYRSLAAEREDRTHELLSITTLRPRQIVAGKLAGAVLQMLVYLSAISPCLAFTYLLRGIDIVTIGMILVYLVLGSLGLSMLCLLLATATTDKYQQVLASVGLVMGLVYTFFGACILASEMLSWSSGITDPEFWIANGALLTAYLSYFALCFLAAAAMLSFVGSNRSTGLRMAMVVQQMLFLGWMGAAWFSEGGDGVKEMLTATAVIVGLHWFVMGMFMTGEPARLSPRVMRDLPQSFLGRVFLTWFNPGPATGYMLAISSYAAVLPMMILALLTPHHLSTGDLENITLVSLLSGAYLTFYLGVGRWVLALFGQFGPLAPVTRVLVYAVLLFVGTIVPLTVQMTLPGFRYDGYTALQATNPFWTLAEAVDHTPTYDIWITLLIIGVAALVVFVLNLPAAAREVRQVRIAAPIRVVEETAPPPAPHVQSNPWDTD